MTLSAVQPTVAVIVPVYGARYLDEALDSVFFQSHPADDVIVIDDGSPERGEIDRVLARWRGRVRLLRQPNAGASAARNAGIRATAANIVAFLDADDCWLPEFLAEQVAELASRNDVDVSYANAMYIGRTPLAGRTFMSTCPSHGAVTLEALLAQACTVPLSATAARRDAILRAGLFDPALRRGQDFDLWLRMARNGSAFAYSQKVLGLRRMHGANLSGTHVAEIERALTVLVKTVNTMDLTTAERAAATRRVRELATALARERGKERILDGDFAAARTYLETAGGGGGWKVRAALLGLRVAPALVRRLYVARADASAAS
jgi:glycosyltransferase involved in cell wall biosynthesis